MEYEKPYMAMESGSQTTGPITGDSSHDEHLAMLWDGLGWEIAETGGNEPQSSKFWVVGKAVLTIVAFVGLVAVIFYLLGV